MAKMFPEWISEEQRLANPKYRAEFRVYDALASSLSDDWYVFYSRTWTWVEDSSRLRSRETDFIVAHPKLGILLMEVKGGRVEVKDGRWKSTDRYGDEWDISPYEQVAIATRSLERRLSEETPNPFKSFRFSTAVCFPDVAISAKLRSLEPKHQRVTIDATRMMHLQEAIVDIMRDSEGNFDPPGLGRILMLKELVAHSWYINAPKYIQIRDTENEIKRLTDSQFKLLYQLAPTARRLLVTGCVGSGKTMLAAEIARRMAVLGRKRVLFTCFNRNLANWIRTSSFFPDNDLLMVANYHKLCADFAHSMNIELPKPPGSTHNETDPIFKVIYPDILLQIAEKTGAAFDAIVVDEGQDFLDSWWLPLLLLLKDEGSFHVYYDIQQQLWGPPRDLPSEVTTGAQMLDLTENVRNTKPIHDLAMRCHPSRGKGYQSLVSLGIDPEFVPVRTGQTEHQLVRQIVENLVFNEQVPVHDIAILTPLSLVEGHSQWPAGKTLLGKFRLVHSLNPAPHEIFFSSIGAAKGLEFPVVILTELNSPWVRQEVRDLMAEMYVGVSRARSHLIIVSDPETWESSYLSQS